MFDEEEVLLNPLYPNGEELADVLVLHDRKLLIFQCKSKRLTFEARTGANSLQLKADLEKAVKNAFDQGVRTRNYLIDNPKPILRLKDHSRELCIDRNQVNAVFIINVTAAPLQNLTTRWANLNPHLELFTSRDYPWSLSLADLDVITEILSTPAHFLHFAKRRLAIEHASREILCEESDLLGFYLSHGLYFEVPEFEGMDGVMLSGMSQGVDEYMFKKYTLGRSVAKPSAPMPPGFEDLITSISATGTAYCVDVAMSLLDFSTSARRSFMRQVEATKERTKEDHQVHDFSMSYSQSERGLSFVAMDTKGEHDVLSQHVEMFALLKKHQQQCFEWIGLGWDMSTDKVIDVTYYAAFEPQKSSDMDEIVASHLGQRRPIED